MLTASFMKTLSTSIDHPRSSEQLSLLLHLNPQDLGMPMHARHQANANRSANSLRHSPLVSRSQASLPAVLDPTHIGHVFGHHTEVLAEV